MRRASRVTGTEPYLAITQAQEPPLPALGAAPRSKAEWAEGGQSLPGGTLAKVLEQARDRRIFQPIT
jgi:hypothetical protein